MKISIRWLWDDGCDPDIKTYQFETEAELVAFKRGIDEAVAMPGYAVVPEPTNKGDLNVQHQEDSFTGTGGA